ncbi:hypothetical protein [Ralstonia phage RP13]|nr:hypothetical protein [Ralstonia phage RP13]
MGNAKVTIKQQDRSAIVPALSGIDIGTVVNAKWGPIVPRLVTTPSQLVDVYYKPDNKKGSSWNGAELLLANSNSVWITRAIHADATYAASLVRFKITNPDFNSYPQPGVTPDVIVKPIAGGIGLTGLASYAFPQYSTNRLYQDSGLTVFHKATASVNVELSGLTTTSGHTFTTGDMISFGTTADNSSPFYTIQSAGVQVVADHVLNLGGNLTVTAGTEVKKWSGGVATSYVPAVHVLYDATATNAIVVDTHDAIINGDAITCDGGTTSALVTTKTLVNRNANIITLDSAVTQPVLTKIQWEVHNEFEYRDAFLVAAAYPGDLGDNIKIGIRASTNYTNAFWVDVYWMGVLEESFEVTRDSFLDGFGNQMQLENKINGISKYIQVIDNVADTSRSIPLVTNYGVWRQNNWDIFQVTTIGLSEDMVAGDVFATVVDASTLQLQDRIKFSATGSEYKVAAKTGNTLTLDRPLVETRVTQGTLLYKFNATLNDPTNGIFNGSQYYKFSKISNLTANTIGDQYTISSNTGVVLDAGTNNAGGGFDGSNVTLYDVINAFNLMGNKEKYKISIFCDNGFTYPEVAIAIDNLSRGTNLSHGYLSTAYTAEISADPVTAVINYRNSTNLNSEYSSIFSGWIQVTDVYNQTKVWVAPSVFGVNAQSFVTRNYYVFTPAAGWVYGRLNGLDISYKYQDGERDALVDAQVNPIRYREGWGLAVWGNETTYVKPSPLQLRSVAMLLIILKYGLENYLEFKLFAMNREPTWTEVEDALTIFIRDTLYTPGGLYAFQVAVKSIITDTDINNRRMPVFVGIQPTMDIKEIPVTLGIFNKSVAISF